MRLYQLLNEVVGSTQKAVPLKDRSADEVYFFIPEKNQIRFTNKKSQVQLIGPVSQIVQSKNNPNIINAVIDYHYRHINIGLDLKKSTSFLSQLTSAALPLKTALYDAKQKKFIVQSNEKKLKRPAAGDVTDPAALAKYFSNKVVPTLKANCKDLFLKVEPDVKNLIQGLKEFIALENRNQTKTPINEETYEYIANDPTIGQRRHGHIEANSEEEALIKLKGKKFTGIQVTSEEDTGYDEEPGFFGKIKNWFQPATAKHARQHSLKLGKLQSRIITQAKNILMVIQAKLSVEALDKLYLKYKSVKILNKDKTDLYDFIRNLSNFEEILTEVAYLGHTEDKLKQTLSKAGNTEDEKQRFSKVTDQSKFLAKLFDKLYGYAGYRNP